ncbi:MAG TPA: 7-carboxy-7-deazaguanine synthase QueE [Paenibacillus sp.]|uniref:7-carboxy-7-deazaguanine synthase QueE n=1 Tax=Paenibacillus sp. TaxID=58172 RepID=UPI002D14F4D6|nr:7-carboxy-7-deazaguanine synthase QueE [Paenibacillus sp.]HUC93908.1 7-carboxy-7-deazaguanine synthase QueE [Paenibacillus sp.]
MAGRAIPVLEIFGPTVQGEGLVIGQKTMFVRTAGCDYSCAWCDSAFTWDGSAKEDIRLLEPEAVLDELLRIGGSRFAHVTLSGGNPALLPQLDELIRLLHGRGMKVALETQGSRWQDWFLSVDDLTISPKPPSSGMHTDWSQLDEIMGNLSDRAEGLCLKVVVFDDTDLDYALTVHRRYPDIPLVLQVGNDDVGTSDSAGLLVKLLRRYEWLVERVAASEAFKQVRVLPQLHTLLWGNKRGV